MQQMTTGQIQTMVGCDKTSAFIHGAHALPGELYHMSIIFNVVADIVIIL